MSTDRRYQARLTERWKQRQGAVTKVYLTATEGTVVLAAAALAVFERRPS